MSSFVLSTDPLIYQTGFLTLNESGAIIASGGDLENDERKAAILYRLISLRQKIDKFLEEGCNKVSVNYKDHSYVMCLSNKKIHIVKKRTNVIDDDEQYEDILVPNSNSINA